MKYILIEYIYATCLTGSVGSGSGLLLIKNGVIAGADTAVGIYDFHPAHSGRSTPDLSSEAVYSIFFRQVRD